MSEVESKLEKPASVVEVREARERAIAVLTKHFTSDIIDVDDFDARLTRAHSADSIAQIEASYRDLPAVEGEGDPSPAVAIATDARPSVSLHAVFGGILRRGAWTVPKTMNIRCVFGGAQLDLREARFAPGVSEIHISAVMGGVHLIVPPGLAVETEGSGIMGGFDHVGRAPAEPDPDKPLLRVRGFACLGGVSVETRLPGEGHRGLRRRARGELREPEDQARKDR